jgi:hypothetical protein
LKDEFNSLIDKVDAGSQREVTTETRGRHSSTGVVTRRCGKIKYNVVRRYTRTLRYRVAVVVTA